MPDRFKFDRYDITTLTVEPVGATRQAQPAARPKAEEEPRAADEEEQERAIVAAVLYAEDARLPPEAVLAGPGMLGGPPRFLPPQQRIHVYWDYVAWCNSQDLKASSLQTFLRAFAQCKDKIRIRNAGAHAVCDTCVALKQQIRATRFPKARQHVLEEYSKHILNQWLDRQVYWHSQELSLSCRDFLRSGQTFETLTRSVSQVCIIADGMDQAKFRVPRILVKTHALDKLLRPALHVQGAWCHGLGYHIAVADADMPKDTNNNVEVVARLLDQVYLRHKGLPLGLHLQQDNTSRECKNSLILRFACKLVGLGIFQWVTLAYLITGHTHENIDGTFGQLAVKIAALEFDDDEALIELLLRLLGGLGVDPDSRAASKAYKLDEAANWVEWWDETRLFFSQITGPAAPHWFRICTLSSLGSARDGAAAAAMPLRSLPGMPPARPDDVVMVVKDRMASPEVLQVTRVMTAHERGHLRQSQPLGIRPRRLGGEDVKVKAARVARELHRTGAIRDAAHDYLVDWSEGTRRRHPRPASYHFLGHRWHNVVVDPPALRAPPQAPRFVQVRAAGGGALPQAAEEADEAEPGPLAIVQ
jgi:hypothetical protein